MDSSAVSEQQKWRSPVFRTRTYHAEVAQLPRNPRLRPLIAGAALGPIGPENPWYDRFASINKTHY